MKFRTDINGLRAIAVLVVVLFHFSPENLSGGFAGVDVFFVISGYLMTSIIFRGIENNNFSFWGFMLSRAKRIIPALLVVVLILLILGYATLGPDAYKMLARHARDSLLFISNITYKNESGYFDAASNTKFLLHTWSLSVEWQFYIIYPLILMSLKRFFSISTLKFIVVGLLIMSLIASILITKRQPETAYFMFYTRAWELMFGGLAFLYPLKASISPRIRFIMEVTGLIIIAVSILRINTSTPWPGYIALLPVAATYLCILADNKNTVLSGYFIEKIGLSSYSIYLIHWPIIVFNYALNWNLSFIQYITIILILSAASYQIIEKRRNYKWGLLVSFIMVLLMAIYVRNTDGMAQRFDIPKEAKNSLQHGVTGEEWNTQQLNVFNQNSDNNLSYIFYGDSFVAQYTNALKNQKKYLANIYEGNCLNTPTFYTYDEKCKTLYTSLKNTIKNFPSKNLVIAQSWITSIQGLRDVKTGEKMQLSIDDFLTQYLLDLSIMRDELNIDKIILIANNNNFLGMPPSECINRIFYETIYDEYFGKPCEKIVPSHSDISEFNEKLSKLTEKEEWLYFIDPNDVFCTNGECTQIIDNLSIYADAMHFSIYGADIVGKYIFGKLNKITDQ